MNTDEHGLQSDLIVKIVGVDVRRLHRISSFCHQSSFLLSTLHFLLFRVRLVWLPKLATELLPIRRHPLRELWSSAATCHFGCNPLGGPGGAGATVTETLAELVPFALVAMAV